MQRRILVIIPVLNEVKNINPIVKKLRKNNKFDVLFIDDNSTDGTVQNILKEKKKYKRIFLIRRPKKLGIGSAHKDGLKWGYKKKYSIIITMDCDGTHNPIYINRMIKLLFSQKIAQTVGSQISKINPVAALAILITQIIILLCFSSSFRFISSFSMSGG